MILDKYKANRAILRTGDIILFRGSDLIDKVIQLADHAYYNHVGIIWKVGERFLICDATAGRGINIDWLSTRMKQEEDFCIIRVDKIQAKIDWAVSKALLLSDESWGYNYLFIIQIAIKKLIGIDFKGLSDKKALICSMFVREYFKWLKIEEYNTDTLCSPQDILRYKPENIRYIVK